MATLSEKNKTTYNNIVKTTYIHLKKALIHLKQNKI